ncbi:MAG: hypothetical protein K0S33_1318 [Bacteroidetes bacterium]|nr:hypothetical protein [Bacteroidota bacterium]
MSLVETIVIEQPDTIAEAVPETGKLPSDTSFVFKNVLFQTNETLLLAASYPELDSIAAYLKKNPQIDIEIEGHTDNSGNEKLNKKLSTGRAKAVSDYLYSKRIAKTRLSYKGYGSSKPLVPNETEEGRRQNRRVELILTKK